MAKKRTTTTGRSKSSPARSSARAAAAASASPSRRTPHGSERDARTQAALRELAQRVADSALAGVEPSFEVPLRTSGNTRWDKKAGILRMGEATSTRQIFNLGQARKFMQTLRHAQGISRLIEQDKTTSLRGMFYTGLGDVHDVAGRKTGEKTFDDQTESDAILEDLEVTLGALREELHIFAKKRGAMVGNITIEDSGDVIDCRKMGSGGYAIPSICEPDRLRFLDCEADFVLHVEKDTVWQRFNEDRFWQTHNCILTEGSGQPPRGVRRLLHRLNRELGLPIICLLDCDPWGHYIYSVIKQGSISLAFESERLAIPDAKFLGIRADDFERCRLSDSVQITLNERDIARAKQIAQYPWFKGHKGWQREIRKLLDNGFKLEVEALINIDISYVTETYVPQRLADRDWLD